MSPVGISRAHPARAIHVHGPTGGLTLRRLYISDTERIHAAVIASVPELRQYMTWAHGPLSVSSALEMRRRTESEFCVGRDLVMGLFDAAGDFLCMIGLHARVPLNPAGYELGYWVPTALTGRGFATLAVRVMALYAFDKLGCDRLQASHDETNLASARVLEKCGFALEGVMRNLLAAPSAEMIAQGFRGTERHCMRALFPDDLSRFEWSAPLRAQLEYENLLGHIA
jgi:RimJ/RimL family protein N-acetyltransferase